MPIVFLLVCFYAPWWVSLCVGIIYLCEVWDE